MTATAAAASGVSSADRLVRVVLDGEPLTRLSPLQEADRDHAVHDLAVESSFRPAGKTAHFGPFVLHLSIQEGRLALDIRDAQDQPLVGFGLALGPFRRLIKDYELLVDSYETAVAQGREARIQAIDMGRRGLHNEGAALLIDRLKGKVEIDLDTARRLFTLLCVMHQRA
jgi:uncharacterized protein (UPF0262 family)